MDRINRSVIAGVILLAACPASISFGARVSWSAYVDDPHRLVLRKIALDASGNTYAVVNRPFPEFALPGFPAPTDVLVAKLDAGGKILYTASFGGKGSDEVRSIAVDAAGDAWIAGTTSSPDFPLVNPIQKQVGGGFIAKLDANGVLVFSTYFGAKFDLFRDSVNALATDAAGNVYFAGESYSDKLPATPGAFQTTGHVSPRLPGGQSSGFVGKLTAAGKLVYLTYLGGNGTRCNGTGSGCLNKIGYDRPAAIAVDATGNAYVAGASNKFQFPVTPGAPQAEVNGPFVAKLNATGTALLYSTGLGGSSYAGGGYDIDYDFARSIAVDGAGEAYVTGVTKSPSFPVTPGALQPKFAETIPDDPYLAPPYDAFVTKLNVSGTAFVYSTYLGGKGDDSANGIAVDAAGNAYVTGESPALVLPADPTLPQGSSFVVELNAAGSAITYAARLPDGLAGGDIAQDGSGILHLGGSGAVVSGLDPEAPAAPVVIAVSNAVGAPVSGRIAAGELVSIWGQKLGPEQPSSGVVENGLFTKSLAGVQVFFDELPAPLLFVSDKQINAAAPMAIEGRSSVTVRVVYNGTKAREFPMTVVEAEPEIFKNPDGSAAAVNQDGRANSAANPAKTGSIVSIYATGTGYDSGVDGSIRNGLTTLYNLSLIDAYGSSPEITYAGAAPDLVSGVTQINFRVPASGWLTSTTYSVAVSVGGSSSEPAFVCFTK